MFVVGVDEGLERLSVDFYKNQETSKTTVESRAWDVI